jgi:hypothetical protein
MPLRGSANISNIERHQQVEITAGKSIGSMMHINPTYWRHAGTAINFQLGMTFEH